MTPSAPTPPRAPRSPRPAGARAIRLPGGAARALAGAWVALLAGCGPDAGSDRGAPWFTEVGVAAGLHVPLTSGGDLAVKETILEVNGNGVALLDVDGDGDLDVALIDGTTRADWIAGRPVRHRLFLNRSEGGLVPGPGGVETPPFESVTGAGLEMQGWPTGVARADVDGDGRPDLVVGGLGEDVLFLNRSDEAGPRFERQPLPGRSSRLDWTTSLALADADGDGRLDLYLARYLTIDPADPPVGRVGALPCRWQGHDVMCGPHGLKAQPDVFLRGIDHAPWFEDASDVSGVSGATPAYGLGLVFTDLDDDGLPDVYVANDSVDNFVLANRGGGRFEHVGRLSGAASDMAGRPQAGMGVAVGDLDADGDLDLAVTNFSDEANAVYRNEGGLLFREVSAATGAGQVSRPLLGWGLELADFDADGALDMLVANGHVYPQADLPGSGTAYAQPMLLLPGRGDGRLGADVFPDPTPRVSRGTARGDLDGDGDLDVIVLQLDGAPLLLLNRADAPERQLLVTLDDVVEPLGAVLRLNADGRRATVTHLSSSSFQCAGDPRLHVGGGGTITAAEVTWPGGERETLDPAELAFGRHVTVRRGQGVVASSPLRGLH